MVSWCSTTRRCWSPTTPLQAVSTALDIRQSLAEFHRQLAPEHRLGINFGIHTGPAVVGNVGTARIMDFTAVGDTVNLASRLCEMAQGNQILISNKTYTELSNRVSVRVVGPAAAQEPHRPGDDLRSARLARRLRQREPGAGELRRNRAVGGRRSPHRRLSPVWKPAPTF